MFPRSEYPSRLSLTLAIEALSRVESDEIGVSLALAKTIRLLGAEDYGAISSANRLVRETLRRQNLIDKIIHTVLDPQLVEGLGLVARSFLRLYTYQARLSGRGKVHPSALVKFGREIFGWEEMALIEEALGKILSLDVKTLFAGIGDDERIGLETFNPAWFVQYCTRLLGRYEALRLLRKNIEIPPVYVRLNSLKGDEKEILARISSEGVTAQPVENLRFFYRVIKAKVPLTRLEAFREGLFFIQDKSSCLAVEVCGARPGFTVLDVCAAPGAKTTYLSQLMENSGRICSIDYSGMRIGVLKRELERMGVKIVHPMVADACRSLPLNVEADVLVLDPPCSSTGVFWKNPLAKWRVEPRLIRQMAATQYTMLENCADHVKQGGVLVYSTCSITMEENEMLVERFLKRNPSFTLVRAEPWVGLPALRGQTDAQRLYPHIHDSNGFYVAKLVKSSE